jgi:predicted metalloendopeptidase
VRHQQKIVQYYERYRLPDGSKADGMRTVQENIADLGALACLTDMAAGTGRHCSSFIPVMRSFGGNS